jgi:hypothetical protein
LRCSTTKKTLEISPARKKGTTRNPAGIPREACGDVGHERKITMRTTNHISMTVLILAISACVASSALSEDCFLPTAVLVHGPSSLRVAPHCVVVAPEGEFTIHIAKPISAGEAVTTPKSSNPDATWLNATNDPDSQKIVITVPAKEGDYDFNITVTDVGTLDPRVRVKR